MSQVHQSTCRLLTKLLSASGLAVSFAMLSLTLHCSSEEFVSRHSYYLPGDVFVESQEALDRLAGVQEVEGSLELRGLIHDLTPLSELSRVGRRLSIRGWLIDDLSDLYSLREVGELSLRGTALSSLVSLSGPLQVGGRGLRAGIRIEENPSLRSLDGLGNVVLDDGVLEIVGNDSLVAIRDSDWPAGSYDITMLSQPAAMLRHIELLRTQLRNLRIYCSDSLTVDLPVLTETNVLDLSNVSAAVHVNAPDLVRCSELRVGGGPEDWAISTMRQVTVGRLSLSEGAFRDLSLLPYQPVSRLSLNGNWALQSLEGMELSTLEMLTIQRCPIRSVSAASSSRQLVVFNLVECPSIRTLDGLAADSLEILHIAGNDSLSRLEDLDAVEFVRFARFYDNSELCTSQIAEWAARRDTRNLDTVGNATCRGTVRNDRTLERPAR